MPQRRTAADICKSVCRRFDARPPDVSDINEDAAVRWLRGKEKAIKPGEPSGREALARIFRLGQSISPRLRTYLTRALEDRDPPESILTILRPRGAAPKSEARKHLEGFALGQKLNRLIGPPDKKYLIIEDFCKHNKIGKKRAFDALETYRKAKGISPPDP